MPSVVAFSVSLPGPAAGGVHYQSLAVRRGYPIVHVRRVLSDPGALRTPPDNVRGLRGGLRKEVVESGCPSRARPWGLGLWSTHSAVLIGNEDTQYEHV